MQDDSGQNGHQEEPLVDKRRTYSFRIDDAVVDIYGRRIGVYGIAVYSYLARRAKYNKSFPGIRRIANDLAIGTAKAHSTLKHLCSEGLIAITPRKTSSGDADTNLYELLDLSHLRGVSRGDTQVYPVEIHGVSRGDTKGVLFENSSIKEPQFKEKEPPIFPPENPSQKPSRKTTPPSPDALAVLQHLNAANGRTYRNTTQVERLLHTGVTLEDCLLVIDFGFAVLRIERPEWYVQYFDNVTPFRPGNFDKYLARAKEWEKVGRACASTKTDNAQDTRLGKQGWHALDAMNNLLSRRMEHDNAQHTPEPSGFPRRIGENGEFL